MAEDTGNGAGTGTGEGGSGGAEGSATLESVQAALKVANEKLASNDTTIKGITADMMKYKGKARELETAQESAQKKKADGATDIEKLKTEYQGIFDTKDKKINELTGSLRDRDVFGNIRSIATKLNVINPDDVVTLIRSHITFDGEGNTVIAGGKVNKETGKAYGLDDFTTEFLKDRTHLIRSSGNAGAGSTGGSTGGSSATFGGFKDLADLAKRGTQDQYNELAPKFMATMKE